jgi:glucose-1-phosphate thymidylyltransferase
MDPLVTSDSGSGDMVVGLVPAAGRGRRIAPAPCSKEILPIGFLRDEDGAVRPRVVSDHLFRKFARAGASKAYVVLRAGKWDIPAYFRDGHSVGLDVAYLVLDHSIGTPDTLDRAYRFVASAPVLFGFPDIVFGPDDVFVHLLSTLHAAAADLVLGLYPAPAADLSVLDMVDVDEIGRVRAIELKPPTTRLTLAWMCAAWTPTFTQFLHGFMAREREQARGAQAVDSDPSEDLPMGAVIAGALDTGLRVYGVPFPHDTFIDIGTPGRLIDALRSASVVDIHQNRGTCDDDLLRQSHERRRTASSLVQR